MKRKNFFRAILSSIILFSIMSQSLSMVSAQNQKLIYDVDSKLSIANTSTKSNTLNDNEYIRNGWPTIEVKSESYIDKNGNISICIDNDNRVKIYELDSNMKITKSLDINISLMILWLI